MPAHPPAPKVVEFAMVGSYGDDNNVTNVFHVEFVTEGPYAPASLLTMAQVFYGLWTSDFGGLVCTAYQWSHCNAKDLSVADGAVATYVPSSPASGTVSTAPLPANCALVISWKEDISYRGGHARTYLCAIPSAEVHDPQHMDSGWTASVQTAANGFLGHVADESSWGITGTGTLCVVHYSLDHTVLSAPNVQVIRSAVVNSRIDSQRRRLGA